MTSGVGKVAASSNNDSLKFEFFHVDMMSTYFLRPFRSAAMPVASRFGFFTLMTRLLMISVVGAATNSAVPVGWAAQFGNRAGVGSEEPVKFSAEFKINPDSPGSRLGSLNVIATIDDGWHIYSVTQKPGGPTPSRIDVVKSEKFSVDGEFQPDVPAEVNETDLFDVPVEEHHGAVVWSAPIQLAEGVDPNGLRIEVTYRGLRCSDAGQCFPIRPVTISAAYGGEDKTLIFPEPPQAKPVTTIKPKQIEPFRPEFSHLTLSGKIVAAGDAKAPVKPGDTVTLQITAELDDNYHVYGYQPQKTDDTPSTLFAFSEDNGWKISSPTPSVEAEENKEDGYWAYYDPVTFSFEVTIPADAEAKTYTIAGLMGFLTCAEACDRPEAAEFSVEVPVGSGALPIPVEFKQAESYGAVEDLIKQNNETKTNQRIDNEAGPPANKNNTSTKEAAASTEKALLALKSFYSLSNETPEQIAEMKSLYRPNEKINYLTLDELDNNPVGIGQSRIAHAVKTTLWTALLGAFFGGILLNLMPCVFPVLGLKVMGFVEQAGSDPKKIRIHGIVFTLGLVVSMWILAGIILMLKTAFKLNISWGAQMGNPNFVVAMIVLLFLLGLNMAGVFEIGTSLTRVGGSIQGKKGYVSSFLSGVLTTLIATPCSGPFLGAAMAYTFAQTATIAMFLFTIFALGIAFPYILLAFFPALINRLPRPGAWMHTFKVTMAFAMFATVAFFMQTFGAQTGVDGLSWLVMALVVLGLAAFFYGTWSPAFVKPAKRFALGFVLPAAIASAAIWMLYGSAQYRQTAESRLPLWRPGKVEYILRESPKILWVDYTAKWCVTCQTNKKLIFSNKEVLEKMKELNVEYIIADYTSMDENISIDLTRMDQEAIPVNLVYPTNYPTEPAVLLKEVITPGQALKTLERMEKIQKQLEAKKG